MIAYGGAESNDEKQGRGLLIILTLKKHEDGIWITKLVERLKESVPPSTSFQSIEIEIRTLEDWLSGGWLISDNAECDNNRGIIGIVNRVSDAASPALFKACCAVLAVAEQSLNIPVWNGSNAYSLCGNKWRHHLLFRQAKLLAPTTMVYYAGHDDGGGNSGGDEKLGDQRQAQEEKIIHVDTQIFRQNAAGRIELLVKPNAGGFGAGIRRISLPPQSTSSSDAANPSDARKMTKISIPSSFKDDMALVQQYEIPRNREIYRVWFLNGKVQCAMVRKIEVGERAEDGDDNAISSSAEFTSGCAGGNSCKFRGSAYARNAITSRGKNNEIPLENYPAVASPLSKTSSPLSPIPTDSKMLPWKVPAEVQHEIEDQLLPLLTDAHCGSVEFLYASSCSTIPKTTSTMHNSIRRNGNNEDAMEKSTTGPSNESAKGPVGDQRLYFDLNLLSTLPVTDNIDIPRDQAAGDTVWPKSFDPWLELALSIWDFCTMKKDDQRKSSV